MTGEDDTDCEGVTAEGGFGVGQVRAKKKPHTKTQGDPTAAVLRSAFE